MNNVLTTLQQNEVQYDLIRHEKQIRSAQEGAIYFGIEAGQTAPALVLKSETEFYALIASGNRGRVNLEEVSELIGCGPLKMASPKEVQQITGYAVGSVPLALSLPCIVDRELYRYPYIYGGSGDPMSTLKIAPTDLEKLNVVVGFLD
ncbi:aminoacyl-tRNA deacylase [Paenibacillus sp. NEAU-GSW1]|uniref:aminoacyl-tRNA deacylase n=1 Tax=Paenibacillus sp. NEAU-GSW1 TaxID=2682486 RepID=UPI0012E14BAE|nr:YbaK/EbsC family protein [Paenibacillus sp. NEAU-GSW1]MUT67837.1 hypothetical protein [Paenibacillus sp. NEAU-GSW1]